MSSDLPVLILVTFALIIISGLFSFFDSALNLCRKTRLEKESSKRYKAVLKVLENPNNLSLSCRLWGSIFKVISVFPSMAILIYLRLYLENFNLYLEKFNYFPILTAFYVIILGVIITLLGDSLPKLLSATKPEKIAAFLLPAMKILSYPMIPLTVPALKFAYYFFN
jgi:CBS domain containing-hemolysin-like protein